MPPGLYMNMNMSEHAHIHYTHCLTKIFIYKVIDHAKHFAYGNTKIV